MTILGIDEAGRGAVAGPLIVAGVCAKENQREWFRTIGVKDSKKLSCKKREEIFEMLISEGISFYFIEIFPFQIDLISLNELEIEASIKIVKQLYAKRKTRVFLDVPAFGVGIERYCAKIRKPLRAFHVDIIGGNKMDEREIIVSAASIVAKVIRDRKIEHLKTIYGDFGSGYPNERSISFIRSNYEKMEPIIRKKWQTIGKIRQEISNF